MNISATSVPESVPVSPVMSVEEVAAYLGISRGLAFTAVRDGSLPSIRLGRRILVPRAQLEALLRGEPT